jgi:hypothetical protein
MRLVSSSPMTTRATTIWARRILYPAIYESSDSDPGRIIACSGEECEQEEDGVESSARRDTDNRGKAIEVPR